MESRLFLFFGYTSSRNNEFCPLLTVQHNETANHSFLQFLIFVESLFCDDVDSKHDFDFCDVVSFAITPWVTCSACNNPPRITMDYYRLSLLIANNASHCILLPPLLNTSFLKLYLFQKQHAIITFRCQTYVTWTEHPCYAKNAITARICWAFFCFMSGKMSPALFYFACKGLARPNMSNTVATASKSSATNKRKL